MNVLDLIGKFTWLWDHDFFIVTKEGNFIYSDPEYQDGDNTIRPTKFTLKQYLGIKGLEYGRDKGIHRIGDFAVRGVPHASADQEG